MSNAPQDFRFPPTNNDNEGGFFELVDPTSPELQDVFSEIIDGLPGDEATSAVNDLAPASIDAESETHEVAAELAQEQVDIAVEEGDYQTAAEFREIAEDQASLAGNEEMLHGADAIDLESAASLQSDANDMEWAESQHAQQGDYEAARDDAFEAEYLHREADSLAGGSDHSGQAQLEQDQMDWAVWHEETATEYANDAVNQLEAGNVDAAQNAADMAVEEQSMADWHGDLGEHAGSMSLDDPFSETANDVGFTDQFTPDTSGFVDSTEVVDTDFGSMDSYDAGFDAGMDTGFDAGLDTSYDSFDTI